ncbi:AABR07015525.1 [Phodopus roborovskii]|uniref:AABR07015525.1 protein n=1 Tax=Phodopus roborovskii TaxID=109678 RepID=A0AAU9ZSY6_PHORO|nr:AABR07015525.1 [Phodopus roborovskii]
MHVCTLNIIFCHKCLIKCVCICKEEGMRRDCNLNTLCEKKIYF